MEFWGVEVKSGESLKVNPGDDKIVHLSLACLGEVNKDKGSEPVTLFVKFGNQKLVIGILSSEKFPQLSHDLIFEKEFELSHNCKNGSVFFTGYKAPLQAEQDDDEDFDDSDEDIPVIAANGKPALEAKNAVKLAANEAKQKEKIEDQKKNKANEKDANGEDEEDSSESDSDEDSSEDEPTANGKMELDAGEDEDDSDDNDEDDDDDDDEDKDDDEMPRKTGMSNKRVLDSSKKTPLPEKKAKLVTPQKTDGKTSGGHVATPYPSKQALKAAVDNRQSAKPQTPKSGGDYSCKPCNRSFKTEDALNSHNKAKHNTAK